MGGKFGLLQRETQQFHWYNQGFNTFDDFLGALASRKRKNIRKERATAQAFGGRILQLTVIRLRRIIGMSFGNFIRTRARANGVHPI